MRSPLCKATVSGVGGPTGKRRLGGPGNAWEGSRVAPWPNAVINSVPSRTPETTMRTMRRRARWGTGSRLGRWRAAGTRREGAGIRGTVTDLDPSFNK